MERYPCAKCGDMIDPTTWADGGQVWICKKCHLTAGCTCCGEPTDAVYMDARQQRGREIAQELRGYVNQQNMIANSKYYVTDKIDALIKKLEGDK